MDGCKGGKHIGTFILEKLLCYILHQVPNIWHKNIPWYLAKFGQNYNVYYKSMH